MLIQHNPVLTFVAEQIREAVFFAPSAASRTAPKQSMATSALSSLATMSAPLASPLSSWTASPHTADSPRPPPELSTATWSELLLQLLKPPVFSPHIVSTDMPVRLPRTRFDPDDEAAVTKPSEDFMFPIAKQAEAIKQSAQGLLSQAYAGMSSEDASSFAALKGSAPKEVPKPDIDRVRSVSSARFVSGETPRLTGDPDVIRTSWRGVHGDIFTTRVRSRYLPVMTTAVLFEELVRVGYGPISNFRASLPDETIALVHSLSLIAASFMFWVGFSIFMLGNNIYNDKRYLLITVAFLIYKITELAEHFYSASNIFSESSAIFEPLFFAVIACMALAEAIMVLSHRETFGTFYRAQAHAKQYTIHLLQSMLAKTEAQRKCFQSSQYLEVGKSLYGVRRLFPSVFLIAAAATVPTIVSISYCTVLFGGLELDAVEASQAWKSPGEGVARNQALRQDGVVLLQEHADSKNLLRSLDRDGDGLISWKEGMVESTLDLWAVPRLASHARLAWRQAAVTSGKSDESFGSPQDSIHLSDDEQSLGSEAAEMFGRRLRTQHAAYKALYAVDTTASELLQQLDTDGDGVVGHAELPSEDIVASLEAMLGPDIQRWSEPKRKALTDQIPGLWERAAGDAGAQGGALNSVGLTYLLSDIKREMMRLLAPVRQQPQEKPTTVSAASSGFASPQNSSVASFLQQAPGTNVLKGLTGGKSLKETSPIDIAMALDSFLTDNAHAWVRLAIRELVKRDMLPPPYVRYRLILYFAVIISIGFSCRTVIFPFIGYRHLADKMLRGTYPYQGGKLEEMVKSRPDYATIFPGMYFATILMGHLVTFIFVFGIMVLFTSPKFWGFIFVYRYYFIFFGTSAALQFGVRLILLNRYCMVDGRVGNPRLFACIWFMTTSASFILGPLNALSRLVLMAPASFLKFHCLDKCILSEEHMHFDAGHASFLVAVRLSYESMNPIGETFLSSLIPQLHRLRGVVTAGCSPDQKTWKRVRNRWQLAIWLHRVPALQSFRKAAIQEARKVQNAALEEEQNLLEKARRLVGESASSDQVTAS
eukprot:gnl/TRDRNA2_/TRDRNA2_169221_c1_seq2.p1 gnl/TRDRNA2_/TRDRNA2_169221_c1~~gnl/TRDRNA2_/TRDRNA2_169221_c1_seq2.p1  ORF type:complete len:1050 (-),score=167.48 gnl/TRDRNA2_/TRDRNA2_169221_c1_seq2:50-3199(-)